VIYPTNAKNPTQHFWPSLKHKDSVRTICNLNSSFIINRTRSNTTSYSSPLTDQEIMDRRSLTSPSIPISPIHHFHSKDQYRETVEIAHLEAHLEFKTLEMLALIKGTTPQAAYLSEKLDEIRSQREKSTDAEDFDEMDENPLVANCFSAEVSYENEKNDDEYLIGHSYIDGEHNQPYIINELCGSDEDVEEDIFGMEI